MTGRTALFFVVSLVVAVADAGETLVHDVAEFDAAVKAAKPDDKIVLANGEWRDVELRFHATGNFRQNPGVAFKPTGWIELTAETPGKVVLTGRSRLLIGGRDLVVSNLLWKDTEASEHVVAFRIDSSKHAERCLLLHCAIIGDAPGEERKWVSLYGKENAVIHCRFEGKQSPGTLLVVWLGDHDGRHSIDHNFFGPRMRLGKNGGEIIRIGDSKTSLQEAKTMVVVNCFYRCDGEAEIISNKSCKNNYLANLFVGCGGALTLRHGNGCEVAKNAFFGDGRKGVGGVRVIGENHHVIGNLFYELTGDDTRAALSLMNGLPDSPLNGYFQVKNARIEQNTFIDCKETIVLGVSDKDQKRQTLPPTNCAFKSNSIESMKGPIFFVHNAPEQTTHENNTYIADKLGIADTSGWTHQTDRSGFDLMKFTLPIKPSDTGPAWLRPGDEYLPEVLKKK